MNTDIKLQQTKSASKKIEQPSTVQITYRIKIK